MTEYRLIQLYPARFKCIECGDVVLRLESHTKKKHHSLDVQIIGHSFRLQPDPTFEPGDLVNYSLGVSRLNTGFTIEGRVISAGYHPGMYNIRLYPYTTPSGISRESTVRTVSGHRLRKRNA